MTFAVVLEEDYSTLGMLLLGTVQGMGQDFVQLVEEDNNQEVGDHSFLKCNLAYNQFKKNGKHLKKHLNNGCHISNVVGGMFTN